MKRKTLIFVIGLACWQGSLAIQPGGAQGAQTDSVIRRPAANSRQEYDDYQSARKANNGAAMEKAASEFAEKYPDSELRRSLFSRALRQYQIEDNPAGILTAGERVLALDPGDTLALALSATVLADGLSAGDPDRETKVTAIKKYATRALQAALSADTGTATPSQAALYRTTLQAMAYSALGIMKLKTGDDAGAEKDLKTAAELPKIRPDPYVWYHLALAQDHRKKYRAALNSVEQALQLASANPRLQGLAETEHERLNQLTGRAQDAPQSGGTRLPE